MSILLIVEVMDWAPMSLTHREHKVLMVLAEDCRDNTRETWRPIDSPDVLRRARLSRTQLYVVLDALIAKGCLERSVAGGFGRRAKYRIPPLAGLRSVPESGTQGEALSVPESGMLLCPGSEEAVSRKPGLLCPENRDAYSSALQFPPENSPVQIDLDLNGTGSRAVAAADEDQKRHRKEGQEDQDQNHEDPEARRRRLMAELAGWMEANGVNGERISAGVPLTGTDGP